MKKHIWLIAFAWGFATPSYSQTLKVGEEVFLTFRGGCHESPEIAKQLEAIFQQKIEVVQHETAFAQTVNLPTDLTRLEELQRLSQCVAAVSTLATPAHFAYPKTEVFALPDAEPKVGFLSSTTSYFNDPLYKKQTFLQIISAEDAYRVLINDVEFLKSPVRIGIIDEGTANDLHEDLSQKIAPGSDVGSNDIKHGQYVLGIMAAQSGNGVGIAGAAPFNAQFTYRAMTYIKGKVNAAQIANTIREFGRLGMDAVNLSIAIARPCSGSSDHECFHPIIADANIRLAIQETAKTYGTVFVISASNEGDGVPRYASPDEGVLVVGSSTAGGSLASYSNRGDGVDLYVPDTGVYGLTKSGYSSSLSGTSFATPIVTATAAMTRHYLISHGFRPSAGEVARHILRNATVKAGLTRNGSSGLELNMGKAISPL